MGATGVYKGSWQQTVSSAGSAVNSIGKVKAVKLSKTDLTPFTEFEETISKINSSLGDFKLFVKQDTNKMIRVGENKAADDRAGAKTLKVEGNKKG